MNGLTQEDREQGNAKFHPALSPRPSKSPSTLRALVICPHLPCFVLGWGAVGNPQAEAAGLIMQPPRAPSLLLPALERQSLRDSTLSAGVCPVEVVSLLAPEG